MSVREPGKRGVRIDDHTVRYERLLPGPAERVWEYIVNGEKRGKWLATGDAATVVGGEFEMHFKHADLSPEPGEVPEPFKQYENGITAHYTVTRWEPPFAFGMTWGDPPEPSIVLFELKPEGDKVRLVLTHSRVPDAKLANGFSKGWHSHLEVLEAVLGGRTPANFWTIWKEVDALYEEPPALRNEAGEV